MGTGQYKPLIAKHLNSGTLGHNIQVSHHTVGPVLPNSKFHILRNQYQNSITQLRQEIICLRLKNSQITLPIFHQNKHQIRLCFNLLQLNKDQDIPVETSSEYQQQVPITIDFELDIKMIYKTFCLKSQ
ncbi:unnamed protein product (macronuclear) [Paramecium tetraurelia]|uniref:Uncharacterized protein n=1 Tax=Paramecium tetraurelia TaxID=5888 RepID=A0DKP4_PARTE|nr:uncharacterized protein GSPATT00017941001 [Paramecium tetraurelia]CAK83611.1 unnamed protein product [Paramecium tetraurelia]|eukprot:XP_001451008.1 hypothetical protein (macronuclear) [Paramecium tetraurelia strain d4-2]